MVTTNLFIVAIKLLIFIILHIIITIKHSKTREKIFYIKFYITYIQIIYFICNCIIIHIYTYNNIYMILYIYIYIYIFIHNIILYN